ncbi:hypothetical protein C7475_1121 [Chitinophaga sp. S165]|nr:hypothetical protein C7475_1121 [Chitinophaga sp. S165]
MILEEKIVYVAVEKNYICIKLVDGNDSVLSVPEMR